MATEESQRTKGEKPGLRLCRRWTGLALAGLLILSMAIRVLYGWEYAHRPEYRHPTFDALYHEYWAKALASGDWTPPARQPDPEIRTHPYFRPPGYPFALAAAYAATGIAEPAPMVAQMALGVLSILLAFLIGRRWGDDSLGLLWAAGMVAAWSFPYFEGELLEPALLVFLGLGLVGSLAYWTEKRFAVPGCLAGLIFGAYALVRPNALLLGPLILAWGLWVARRARCLRLFWKGAGTMALASALLVLPVTLRNHRTSGEWVFISANGGVNLYCGNNPLADGYSPGAPEISAWDCFDYPQLLRALPSRPGMGYAEASREFGRRARTYAWAHPGHSLRLLGQKTLLFWGPREVGNNKDDDWERRDSAILRRLPVTFAWAQAGFWLGVCMWIWRRRRGTEERPGPGGPHRMEVAALLGLLAMGLFASYLPFIVAGRYRVPILPFLLFFGADAVQRLWIWFRMRQWRRLAAWSLVGAGLALAAHWNLAGYVPDQTGFLYGRGRAYDLDGQPEKAAEFFRRAAALDSRFAPMLTGMARTLAARGKEEEALLRLRHALAGNPGYLDAYLATVDILEQTGRTPEARAVLDVALTQFPRSTALRQALSRLEPAQ